MAKVKQDIQEPDRLIFDQRQAIDYQNKSWKGLSTDLKRNSFIQAGSCFFLEISSTRSVLKPFQLLF